MKQKLWVISELFPPEETSTAYIMGEIANVLTKKYDVSVICGPVVYDQNKKLDGNNSFKLDESIDIIRVKGIAENKGSVVSRITKFLLISCRLYLTAKFSIKKGEKVFMVSNPFPLILLMAHLKRKRDFHLTMLIHDVFPEALYTEMNLSSMGYSILGCMFNKAYARVDTMISLGRDMTEVMSKKVAPYKKDSHIVQVENWGDVVSIHPKEAEGIPSDKVVIEYAGNIGQAQGVSGFVKLVEQAENDKLAFCVWGTGIESENIKQYIKEKHIDNVVMNGSYSRSQQNDVLNDCDIAIITLVDGMYGLGVPSKSYNIMAAGKPILFIGDLNSEIALTIKENNIGYCFDSSDVEGIVGLLKNFSPESKNRFKEMGARSRELVEKKYTKDVILQKFVETV